MRVVIDTSVWVSALLSAAGAPTQVVTAMAAGRITVISSPKLLTELTTVLARERFRRWFSTKAGEVFVAELARRTQLHPDIIDPPAATRDVNDDYLVALAQAHDARIVSVDKDLLDAHLNPPALTPRELLHLLA
ncbi:MAG: putative toxin-antitoxin system toxin component, PIN family [Mycobacteriales bacterium]